MSDPIYEVTYKTAIYKSLQAYLHDLCQRIIDECGDEVKNLKLCSERFFCDLTVEYITPPRSRSGKVKNIRNKYFPLEIEGISTNRPV